MFWSNEMLNQILTHDLRGWVAHKFLRIFVPLCDLSMRINSINRHVRGVNQLGGFSLLSNSSSDVLANTHNSNNIALLVTLSSVIE